MGITVELERNEPKSEAGIRTELAAAISLTANHMGQWQGDLIAHRQVEARTCLLNCAEALRERGFPNAAVYNWALMNIALGKNSLVLGSGAALPTPASELFVMVMYHSGFVPPRGSTHMLMDTARLLREAWLENRKAA